MSELLKHSNLDGYFTNHSLRRTGATRLFNAGVDRKLVKEYHTSDAVDQYQITSDDQREQISNIIGGRQVSVQAPVSVELVQEKKPSENSVEIEVKNKKDSNEFSCSCTRTNVNLEDKQGLGQLINDMLAGRKYGKDKVGN